MENRQKKTGKKKRHAGRTRDLLIVGLICFGIFLTGLLLGIAADNIIEKINPKAAEVFNQNGDAVPSIIMELPVRERVYGTIPINPYDQAGFVKEENGFRAYYEGGQKISHLGIDVSSHQTNIDWEQVKASGIEFVMIRCGFRGYTEGGLVEDEMFRSHIEGALAAGLSVGVYFFTQAVTEEEAIEEAEFTLSLIKDYKLSYPVAIDTEFVGDSEARTRKVSMSKEERSKICIAYMETIRKNGYYPIVYASENWCRRNLDLALLEPYDFWVPQYNEVMDFLYDFTMWQYTETGAVSGVEGKVDINISMVDYAGLLNAK